MADHKYFYIEKRMLVSPWIIIVINIVAIILALAFGSIFLVISGYNPVDVYVMMADGAFGSGYAIAETTVKMIPIMLCGLGVGIAFRMKLWNIGAEGQLYIGGLFAAWVAFNFTGLPSGLLLPLMMFAGFLGGGVWALVCAIPRAYWGTNETLTTLMLNYVAILVCDFLVHGVWRDPQALNFPLSAEFVPAAWLPVLPGGRVHLGLLIGVAAAAILFLIYKYSKWGYETTVIGESSDTARYAGIDVVKNIMLAMFISGGLAGLAGMTELSGVIHRVQPNFSPGYGFTAIIVAWLAKLNPWATIPVAFLMAALLVGGYSIQTAGLPASTASMLQGTILFFILGCDILANYKIVLKKQGGLEHE